MESTFFFAYLGAAIISLVIFALVIRWAVSADTNVKHQRTIIALLIELCKKQGVPEDQIDGVKSMFKVK